jgi:hypothetical protein
LAGKKSVALVAADHDARPGDHAAVYYLADASDADLGMLALLIAQWHVAEMVSKCQHQYDICEAEARVLVTT